MRNPIFFFRPLVRLRIVGSENLTALKDEPVVLVCNHGFIYGPIAALFNMPIVFRPWVDSVMLNRRQCRSLISDKFRYLLFCFGSLRNRVVDWITAIVMQFLGSFNPIPVYKGSENIMLTLNQSVDSLLEGKNLLIFPEHPRTDYPSILKEWFMAKHLRTFYCGFARIGEMYYERTGNRLAFVPVYINRWRHTIHIAPAIYYNKTNDISGYHPMSYLPSHMQGTNPADYKNISSRLYNTMRNISTSHLY